MHKLAPFRYFSVFLSILAIFISGCSSTNNSVHGTANNEIEKHEIKKDGKITVISLMGNTLESISVGITIFNNVENKFSVAKWEVDRNIEDYLIAQIHLHTEREAVIYDPGVNMRPVVVQNNFWTGELELPNYPDFIMKAVSATSSDYVLVVAPVTIGDPYFNTAQNMRGYGVYQRSFIGTKQAVNYVTMQMVLYDGVTGKQLARSYTNSSLERDSELLTGTQQKPDDSSLERTRKSISSMFDHNVDVLLKKLALK